MNGLGRGGCWILILRAEIADEAALFLGGALVVEGDEAGEEFFFEGVLPVSLWGRNRRDACAPFEEELLTRLVALNHERAAEEKKGLIRWLRPEYQNPKIDGHRPPLQGDLSGTETAPQLKAEKPKSAIPWPATLAAQVTEIQKLLPAHGVDAEAISGYFGKKSHKRTQQVAEILETLQGLGKL